MNREQAQKFFEEHKIRYVLAQFVDIHGAAKAKAVPVEHLDMVLTDGAGFAGFALWGLGMGPEGPDYMAVGDLSTLQRHPVDAGIRAHHLQRRRQRKILSVLLASRAASADCAARGAGLTLFTGIEPEFMLLSRRADGSFGPADATDDLDKPCYDYKGLYRTREVLDEMVAGLRAVGIDVYQIDHEDGNGQFEINFTYADALKSADNFTFVKMAASEIAHKHGMIATFMPKPFSNRTGSGAHFHVSLGSASQKNAFHDPSDKSGMGLSAHGLSVPGRCAAHARALCAVAAPDREFVQAAGGGPLAVGRDLGAGLHRLRRQQPHRLRAHSARPPRDQAARFRLQSVSRLRRDDRRGPRRHRPQTRSRAAAEHQSVRARRRRNWRPRASSCCRNRCTKRSMRSRQDRSICDGLGPDLAREFIRLKRMEWTEYSRHVSDWESRRYLEFF